MLPHGWLFDGEQMGWKLFPKGNHGSSLYKVIFGVLLQDLALRAQHKWSLGKVPVLCQCGAGSIPPSQPELPAKPAPRRECPGSIPGAGGI